MFLGRCCLFSILSSLCLASVANDAAASTTALTTFSPAAAGVYSKFAEGRRHFFVAGHNWTVEQSWDDDGVAGVVWQASAILSEHLADGSFNFSGRRVLELGAGAGLPGLVAASLGGSVVLTEHHSAVRVTRKSVRLNRRMDLPEFNVEVRTLDWGTSVSSFHTPVDFVLGADVVYLEETFPALISTVTSLTDCRRSTVVLALTIRYARDISFLDMFDVRFQCSHVAFDTESSVVLLHARPHCKDEKIVPSHSCTAGLESVRNRLKQT